MARIEWRPEAVSDIDRLRAFLYSKNPKAAQQAAIAIINTARLLERTPEIGRPLADGTKRRELIIPYGNSAYILRDVFEHNNIFILGVWHSREDR